MLVTTRTRRKRAAIAKAAMLATLAVLLFTPRMEVADLGPVAGWLPSAATNAPTDNLLVALR